MNKNLFFLFVLFGFQSFSQTKLDSIELEFSSDYEESMLMKSFSMQKLDETFLEILFAIDSSYSKSNYKINEAKVNTFLIGLERKISNYNEKKRVKYLFDQTHKHFFKKYEIDSYFSDIFKSYTYNCVTATALYAYLFDYFKIPYQIKETPTHVFLVAYPKKHNIYIETTAPGANGSYAPSEGMIKKAINRLVDSKIITRDEVNKIGYSKAFNDYYYGDENITKKELVGIQYYNKAIVDFNNEHYKDAYNNICKSMLFYKNKKTELFNELLLNIIVDKADFKKVENFKWFITLAQIEDNHDFLKYKLEGILKEDTWGNVEYELVENYILTKISNEELENEFLQVAYGARVERYNKLQQYKKALVYAEKIYRLNPNHLTAKNYICRSKIESLVQKNLTEDRLEDLELLVNQYPFVTDFGLYMRYKIYLHAYLTANSFSKDKSTKALQYLSVLESMIDNQTNEVDFNQEAIGNAYGAAGAFFTERNNRVRPLNI